jgi:DNA-3-methyladenine glycosylase
MNVYETSILGREFYNRSPEQVAKGLLGKYVVRKIKDELLVGKITETEAYLSSGDEAAHSFKGETKRTKSLYKNAGHAYVHSMRQWNLLDVVTEGIGIPSSVLIRAVEPCEGIETMQKNRTTRENKNLTNGPGKFCQAFQIDKKCDGIDIASKDSVLFITDSEEKIPFDHIGISGRIGISKSKDMPLRFWIKK